MVKIIIFSLLIHLIQSLLIKHVALLAYVIHVQQNEHNALVLNLHYRFFAFRKQFVRYPLSLHLYELTRLELPLLLRQSAHEYFYYAYLTLISIFIASIMLAQPIIPLLT